MLIFDDDTEYTNTRQEPDKGHLTLSMLNGLVKQTIELTMSDQYWVEAELASVHENRGHCYMELIEKDEFTNTPVAQARACCWSRTWLRIGPRFVRETGQQLHAGMKVLLKVKANFHEAYGFSWIVNDIDPTYTMGDMARKRQQILQTLRDEGVIDLNKSLEIPMFAKRIAVISSATAAGYGDFCNQLIDNDYGFQFTSRLFPALMQGEGVEQSVIAALEKIYAEVDNFDVVVITRGGGSTSDLSGFDTLALAENVANFPLPIITGIGHDRDQSILDIIVCRSVKTPTAAAEFLISNLAATYDAIMDCTERITRAVQTRMQTENLRLSRIEQYLASAFSIRKVKAESHLDELSRRMAHSIGQRLLTEQGRILSMEQRIPILLSTRIEREQHRLQMLEQKAQAQNPVNILRRGYSIALHDGYAVRDPKALKPGDQISLVVEKGIVETIVAPQ